MNFIQLSKAVSNALRHEPQSYGLALDDQGWVSLSDLVSALNSYGMQVDEKRIVEMIEWSDKKRHQLLNGKIRAYYGHSMEKKILKNAVEPPMLLYHGTVRANLNSIMENGLLPMARQYVHLSLDKRTAEVVGSRKDGMLVVLKVEAKNAALNGVQFYEEDNGIWLSDSIPPKYISE